MSKASKPEFPSFLVLEGSHTSFDALDSPQQQLAFGKLAEELSQAIGVDKLDRNTLISLELESPKGIYNNAAALLADANPFFGIDIARFGESMNIILSRQTLERQSVLLQLNGALEMFDEYYAYEEIEGFERKRKELIPREAFREAIANALVHRRWDVNASINVRMLPNRIEITSPGGLPTGVSEEAYLSGGLSVVRNPILANVFFRLGHIERFGTGVPRIIEAYRPLAASPSFSVGSESITVVLPVDSSGDLSRDERAVLNAIPKGGSRSRTEIETAAGMTKEKTIRLLNDLVGKDLVRRTGAGRSTRYSRL